MSNSDRLFEFLLRLYPAGFRAEYGDVMRQAHRDDDARTTLGVLADFLLTWPGVFGAEIAQDLRFTLRTWQRRPLLITLAILTMGAAMGVSTGAFSVLNAMLLRALPFDSPEQLVHLDLFFRGNDTRADLHRRIQESTFLANLTAYSTNEFTLSTTEQDAPPDPRRIAVTEASPNFFRLLGVQPRFGRLFDPSNESEESIVISHALFEQQFGADLRAIGSTLRLAGHKMRIIGVAPPSFDFPRGSAAWTATMHNLDALPKSGIVSYHFIGRLKTGMSIPQAQAAYKAENKGTSFAELGKLRSLREELSGPVGRASQVLFAAVLGIVGIAAMNLAGFLLTRFAERARELAIRRSLGAGDGRIRQQILTESLALSLAAALTGLAFVFPTIQLDATFLPARLAFQDFALLDWHVFAFGATLTALCGLFLGALPAWFLNQRWSAVRRLLLAAQIALSASLLLIAVQFSERYAGMLRKDLGYAADHTLTFKVSLAGLQRPGYWQEALAALRSIDGVRSVGAFNSLPLAVNSFAAATYNINIPGKSEPVLALSQDASDQAFQALGARLLAGREFSVHDHKQAPSVAIINHHMAKLLGGVDRAIGQPLRFAHTPTDPMPTVVGVVGDISYAGPAEDDTIGIVYRPIAQHERNFYSFVINHKGNTATMQQVVKQRLLAVEPNAPPFDIKTMRQRLEERVVTPRFYTYALGFLGGLSLLLTLINAYALVANGIEQRRKELGIRIALGATVSRARRAALRDVLPAVTLGLALAAVLGTSTPKAVASLLSEGTTIYPTPWWCLAALGLIALLAAWLTTRRILRLNPADILRAE
jgi:predicted permease